MRADRADLHGRMNSLPISHACILVHKHNDITLLCCDHCASSSNGYVRQLVLVNAFNQNVIDFSHADIHELKSNKMTELELEKLLDLHNEYSFDRFSLRMYQKQ